MTVVASRSAVISPCEVYRPRLDRDLGRPGRTALFCGVNPSTAGPLLDDQTVRKLYGFAERNDIGKLILVNKFDYRATDVLELRRAAAPSSPENDRYIEEAMAEADLLIVGWGPLAKLPTHLQTRWRAIVRMAANAGLPMYCLGVALDGHPRHPSRVGYDQALIPWAAP